MESSLLLLLYCMKLTSPFLWEVMGLTLFSLMALDLFCASEVPGAMVLCLEICWDSRVLVSSMSLVLFLILSSLSLRERRC